MSFESSQMLDWASDQCALIWEVMAHNYTQYEPFGPTSLKGGFNQNRLDLLLSSAQLGALSGLMLFLFLLHKVTRWREERNNCKLANETDMREAIYTFLTFLEFLALSPVFLAVLLIFQLYRLYVSLVLKRRHGKHFKGLLDGADVVWAIEDQNSRGMINIMASVHEPFTDWASVDTSTTSVDILLTLRKRIASRLMRHCQPHPKMFWKRHVEMGYYFWSDRSELTLEDYIRFLDTIPLAEGQRCIDEGQFRVLLGTINNRMLPDKHSSSWEVLVGRQPLIDERLKILKYPILFRVHHSLGDGVALMRLLLETIVDKEASSRWKLLSKFKVMNIDYILKSRTVGGHRDFRRNDTLFERLSKWFPSNEDLAAYWDKLTRVLWTCYTAPAFLHQVSRRQIDDNCLHATETSNEKVVSWIHEEHSEGKRWIDIMKRAKHLLPGTRFSDILLTALSASLNAYFSKVTNTPPKSLTVVLPARIEKESPYLKLHNRFSVALQTLPIIAGIQVNAPNRHYALTKRIVAVKSFSDALRASSEYMINYWIISKMTALFPESILRRILKSSHSTIAISNLPGPQQISRISGRELRNLCFFIPNLGTTAVGITLLTYGGKVQLGILADRAVIATEDDAHSILQGTVEEIERMGHLLEGL